MWVWCAMMDETCPMLTCFFPQWGVCAGALVIAAPLIFLRITDHVSLEEDLKFSDETVEDVAPTAVVADHKDDKAGDV